MKSSWPIVGLFVCLGLVFGCSKKEQVPETVRAVKLIEVGPAQRGHELQYAGEVRARTESRLGFQVAGRLQERIVNPGDAVQAGQVLARLDAQDYVLTMQAAQAQVAAAQTQRDVAQADWQRFSALRQQGFISEVELDRRRASLQSAQAQLDQANAQGKVQSNQAAYTQLRATHAGVVTAVMAEPGQVVAAGGAVVQLAHAGDRDVVISIPENALSMLRLGQLVHVTAWDSTQRYRGEVREIAASADAVTRTYPVKVALHMAQPLPLGSTVTVYVAAIQDATTSLKLPSTALWMQGNRSAVWVFDAATSTVQAQSVEVVGVQGNDMLIASGLTEGMRVVSTGIHVLREGQKVSVYSSVDSSAQ